MTIVLEPVRSNLPAGFDDLRFDAGRDGHTNMERLAADWATGANRFDREGEALLAGVGGLTIDPNCAKALRMRRFYVRPKYRRHGVGRCLAEALMARAGHTNRLVLNAETRLAACFWEAMGFVAETGAHHTHVPRR